MAGLNALLDHRKLALARARFHAWWEGETFDPAAVLAALEARRADKTAVEPPPAIEDELFDAPPFELPARLVALNLLWGEGRIRPGDAESEAGLVARLKLPVDGVLAVLGQGLEAPLAAIAAAHPGKIEVFEWREEAFAALRHGVERAGLTERISLSRIDIEALAFTTAAYDGVLSIDDFAYCSFPPQLAHKLFKAMKPGARAIVESYVGEPSRTFATAFASSFAEPQIRPVRDLIKVFGDSGFALETDEDVTDGFLGFARAGFKQLGARLSDTGGLGVSAAQELAWEAEAWRTRMTLLAQRRLERLRFVLVRPAAPDGAQTANANAPAG